jgi:LmbE family N-acetylglucosaminyl deacetylase
MKRIVSAALMAGAVSTTVRGGEFGRSAGELAHDLDRLAQTGRVLYVAAHPDDENTRLLAYLANGRHLLAGYLSMTRGGGGQNLIGPEQGDLLDVIRTEELLAARGVDGAVQRFTRMRDFGYSKSAKETLAFWNHDEALADVVWVIRTFQPDVIVTRFDEQPPNHGHHSASAILAREAFTAAADAQRFPEQLRDGVTPWQADRLLRNLASWRQEPAPKDAISLDVGAYDARLGVGYGELAARSRSQHRSQGFGVPGERGALVERFAPVAGTRPAKDLFEGLELGWARFGERAAPLSQALAQARATLDRDRPELALAPLLAADRALDALPDVPRVRHARRSLERVVCGALGLFVRATAPRPFAVPGSEVKVDVEIVQRRPGAVALRRVAVGGGAAAPETGPLVVGEKKVVAMNVTIPPEAAISVPYWLVAEGAPGRQAVSDARLVGEPAQPPALTAEVELTIEDRVFRLSLPVVHVWTDPVLGERMRPFLIVPPATVTPAREAVLLPNGGGATVALRVKAGRDDLRGEVVLPLPPGWRVAPVSVPVTLAKAGDETTVRFEVSAAAGAEEAEGAPAILVDGKRWSLREATVDYPHIPPQLVLQPAHVHLVPLALRLPEGTVGYVEGSGDSVAEDLAHVGVRVEVLDDETLRSGDLSRFAAIVVGIRAYNTRDAVRAAHARLMEFVERGGTLVTQYNTNNRLSPLQGSLGPFPMEIGRDRITDENAAMVFTNPDHPALRAPNAIVAADFEGWVQERGIYFASSWDPRYEPLFSAADADEEPLKGGTLVARHGKGRFVYTGLAFFRQLPAGVPGAYRLFANLLARD